MRKVLHASSCLLINFTELYFLDCVVTGGVSCSNITCPTSLSWFGDIGENHTLTAECGGVGQCDGNTGVCL